MWYTVIGQRDHVQAQALGVLANGNVRLLRELNASWVLPEDYILEVREVDGRVVEWVQEQDIQPEQVILQLHGGAYIRSLADNGATYRREQCSTRQSAEPRWQQWITGWLPNTPIPRRWRMRS